MTDTMLGILHYNLGLYYVSLQPPHIVPIVCVCNLIYILMFEKQTKGIISGLGLPGAKSRDLLGVAGSRSNVVRVPFSPPVPPGGGS